MSEEVERLRADVADRERAIKDVECERDEALAQVAVLLKAAKEHDFHALEVSANNSILQARTFLDRLAKAEAHHIYCCLCDPKNNHLKDRLQRAEASVRKWEEDGDTRAHERIVELTGHNDYLERQLRKAEAVVEAAIRYDEAIRLCADDPQKMASYCTATGENLDILYLDWITKALAAWEEKKA